MGKEALEIFIDLMKSIKFADNSDYDMLNFFNVNIRVDRFFSSETEIQARCNFEQLISALPTHVSIMLDLEVKSHLKSHLVKAESLGKISTIAEILNLEPRNIGLNLTNNSLKDINETFVSGLKKIEGLTALNLTNCQLDKLDPKLLNKIISSLLTDFSLTQFKMRDNGLWNLDLKLLKEIALIAAQRSELKEFDLFGMLVQDDIKLEIQKWSRERQKSLLEIQLIIEPKISSGCQEIIVNSLTPEDVVDLIGTFIEKCPEKNISSWLKDLPTSLADVKNDLTTKKTLIELRAKKANNELVHVDLSGIAKKSKTTDLLKEEINKSKKFLGEYELGLIKGDLNITLCDQNEEQILYMAEYINQLNLHEVVKLNIIQNDFIQYDFYKVKYSVKKIMILLNALNNKSISYIGLQNNPFNNVDPLEIDLLMDVLANNNNIFRLDLMNTGFSLLGEIRTTKYIEILKRSQNLTQLDLSNNNILESFGAGFLLKLNGCKSSNSKFNLVFFDNNDFPITKALETLDENDRFEISKMFWIARLLKSPCSWYSVNPTACLTNDQNYKLIQELSLHDVGKIAKFPLRQMSLTWGLEPKVRGELIKSHLKNENFINSCINAIENKEIDLFMEDKVEIFLRSSKNKPDIFYRIDGFRIYNGDNAVNRILSSMRGVIKDKSYHESANYASEEDDIDEQTIVDNILKFAIPQLEFSCNKEFPFLPFVKRCLNSIESHKTEESVFPFLRMTAWLIWSCAQLSLMPQLIEILKKEENVSEKDIKCSRDYFSTFNAVMKQILDFANPQMRYDLTDKFFNKICLDKDRTYFKLVEKCSLDALLPAIIFCDILLQETDEKLKTKNLEIIVGAARDSGLLSLCSNSQYYGRFYRSMMAGLTAISEDTTLTSSEKLTLIQKIMDKSKERKEVEAKIEEFVKLLSEAKKDENIEFDCEKIINYLKEKLEISLKYKIESVQGNKKACRTLKRNLIDNIVATHYKKSEFFQQVSSFIMVQGLANLGRLSELCKIGKEDFDDSARKILQEIFDLKPDQLKFYNETFAKCHNEAALLTYYSKICTLKEEGADRLMLLFKSFVQTVLSANSIEFYKMKYSKELNPQLNYIFKNNPGLEALWKEEEIDLEEFIKAKSIAFKEYNPNFSSFIRKKIFGHEHLEAKYYMDLKQYLSEKDENSKKSIKEKIEKAALLESSQSWVSLSQAHSKIMLQLLRLVELPLDFNKELRKRYDEHLKILQKIISTLNKTPDLSRNHFKHDVEALIKGLRANRKPMTSFDLKGWKIVLTGHYWRLFMCGTDVEGSCQSTDGSPSLSKCLLGYVANGYIKEAAIIKPNGETYGRNIIKLLKDTETHEPGLFFEETYPETLRPDLQEALTQFVILYGKKLQIPVGTLENLPLTEESEEPLENQFIEDDKVIEIERKITWESIGGVAPYEYEDGLYGVKEDGVYEIPGIQILYRPKPKIMFEQSFQLITMEEQFLATKFENSKSEDKSENKLLLQFKSKEEKKESNVLENIIEEVSEKQGIKLKRSSMELEKNE